MDVIWCPHDLPRDAAHSIYWDAVRGVQEHHGDTERQDEWALLIAHMECAQVFSDAELAEWLPVLGPSVDAAHSIRTMPDLCDAAVHVGLWRAPETEIDGPQLYWAQLLTRALPNPCKGRSIGESLAKDVVERPDVYDCVLRVLFGTFLGVYEGSYEAPFDVRIMCYAAFALHAPTPEELAQFVQRRKLVTTFCFRAYLLFLISQTPMHDYLCARYQWQRICDIVSAGMDDFRRALGDVVAGGPGFLVDGLGWHQIDTALYDVNKNFKKYVFRAATEPFYKRVLHDMVDIQRLELKGGADTRVTSLPVPRLCLEDLEYCLAMARDRPSDPALVRGMTDVRAWGGLHEFPEIETQFDEARRLYDAEERMTGARRLLYGTESKPNGLFRTNRAAYERLEDFMRACNTRLGARWGLIPTEWLERQREALRRRTEGVLPKDAATYFFCPQCCAVRSAPATWPEGRRAGAQNTAFYSRDIGLDLHTMQHSCATRFNQRRKDAIMRRRSRNARKNRKTLKHPAGDDIRVCDGTPVIPVEMAGLLLYTETDGLLLLCVYCACLLHFTPRCMTPLGPSCGCNEPAEPPLSLVPCAICGTEGTHMRHHRVIGDTGIEEVAVCREHGTRYANQSHYMFTLDTLKMVARDNLRVRMSNDVPYFHERRPSNWRRSLGLS